MAAAVAVQGSQEKLKQREARRLVRRGWAEWVVDLVMIRRLKKRCLPDHSPRKRYIPAKMPPLEVPNCYFQRPQSLSWQAQHGVMRHLYAVR